MIVADNTNKDHINAPIVIIGGGAGGLELATKLGRYYKKRQQRVVLVDQNRTHIWKPLLHEVAAGALDSEIDGVDYLAIAHKNGFTFQLGTMIDLNRESKTVYLAPLIDDAQQLVLEKRELNYSKLIFALGSITNDFGTEGAAQNCIFLDSPKSAQNFHTLLLNEFLKLQDDTSKDTLEISIVGAGATGVELSAELYKTTELLKTYGYTHLHNNRLKVRIIESGPRLLPALPERIANSTQIELEKLGVEIILNTFVTKVEATGLYTKDGNFIKSNISVWAAGIKAPEFLQGLSGLETNKINQLVVNQDLITTLDDSIYAIGDCAHCIMPDGSKVPPRAQSAHQMASNVFTNIKNAEQGKELKPYLYVDYGSLVSLSTYSTIGSLMGNMTKGSMFIEGRLARIVYISLYRMHQMVIFGKAKTLLIMLVNKLNKRLRPNLKLH